MELTKALFSRRNLIIFVITIGLVGGGLYGFKDQLIVATVNGQFISRLELIKELEKQYGQGTLEAIVTEALILQEANKQGVSISEEEISQEIQKLEEDMAAQGQDLSQILSLQGVTQEELKKQIMLQKTVEEIVKKDIEVTAEDVEKYYEENKDSFPEDEDVEALKNDIKLQLEQQKLTEGINSWIQGLHDSAKINYLKEF